MHKRPKRLCHWISKKRPESSLILFTLMTMIAIFPGSLPLAAVNVPVAEGRRHVTIQKPTVEGHDAAQVVGDAKTGFLVLYPSKPTGATDQSFTVEVIALLPQGMSEEDKKKVSARMIDEEGVIIVGGAPRAEGQTLKIELKVASPSSHRRLALTFDDKATDHPACNVNLLPVEFITDMNNDGVINGADNALRDAALKSGATDEDKEKGTEYLFINDKMSNGAWDSDDDGVMSYSYGSGYDTMPKPPASHKDDDDAEPLKVSVGGLKIGVVWFEHPTIDKLEFFETRECLPSDKLNITASSPFDLSVETLPETIYVRLRDDWAGTEQEGNLRMFIGESIAEIWAELQLPLTVVRDFGSKHFFHAARDYILENNTRVCIRDHGYPFGPNPSIIFRLCTMREEATTMTAFDALAGGQEGIELSYHALPAVPSAPAVMINGNQCFWSAGWDEKNPFDLPNMLGNISDKCHGRVIRGGVTAGTSSDNFDITTKPASGSPLAGPDPIPAGMLAGPDGVAGTSDDIPNSYAGDPGGKYLGWNSGTWTFAAGLAGGTDALGGLSTNYASAERADKAHQMIGYAEGEESGKGCIFTATQIKGVGFGSIFKGDASVAGVPALSPSVDTGAIKLFILDSGAGSLALMHIDPAGAMQGAYMGRKTNFGFPYYVNNYLALNPAPPRP